jgi:hypothetical protein
MSFDDDHDNDSVDAREADDARNDAEMQPDDEDESTQKDVVLKQPDDILDSPQPTKKEKSDKLADADSADGPYPPNLDSVVSDEDMLELRKTKFHISAGFGHVYLVPVDLTQSPEEILKCMPVIPNKPFVKEADWKPNATDWYIKVVKSNIAGLPVKGAIRELSDGTTTVSKEPKVVPFLSVRAHTDGEEMNKQLFPMTPALIRAIFDFGAQKLENPQATGHESWKKIFKELFFKPYGATDLNTLRDEIKTGIWFFNKDRVTFMKEAQRNEWPRRRLEKKRKDKTATMDNGETSTQPTIKPTRKRKQADADTSLASTSYAMLNTDTSKKMKVVSTSVYDEKVCGRHVTRWIVQTGELMD